MNYEEIKNLIDEMGKANFEELNIEFPDGVKISMKKNTQTVVNTASAVASNVVVQPSIEMNTNKSVNDGAKVISAPMVGTFYNAPSPNDEPFVKVGDRVKKGQVLCIIEAMKLMNEIESEYDGEIVEVCLENEGVVEYGMPLFRIRGDK